MILAKEPKEGTMYITTFETCHDDDETTIIKSKNKKITQTGDAYIEEDISDSEPTKVSYTKSDVTIEEIDETDEGKIKSKIFLTIFSVQWYFHVIIKIKGKHTHSFILNSKTRTNSKLIYIYLLLVNI